MQCVMKYQLIFDDIFAVYFICAIVVIALVKLNHGHTEINEAICAHEISMSVYFINKIKRVSKLNLK